MNNKLKVAVIPLPVVWADLNANLAHASSAIRSLPHDVDIAVLPELFNTGFISDPDQMKATADTPSRPVAENVLRSLSRECNLAICAGILARDNDNRGYVNRAVFTEPGGETTVYDKRHLFIMSRENRILSPGSSPVPVIRFRGWDIAMTVCYDLRFPAWMRNNSSHPYDLMLVPANWPQKREYAWTHLLIARAIENQAYIIGANRSGSDDFGTYDDMTRAFDPLGKPVELHPSAADVHASAATPLIATLERKPLEDIRESFPVLLDADTLSFP